MTLFRITVTGTGFRKAVDGVTGRYSFLTYRFVDAATPEAAGDEAVRNVAARDDLREQLGPDRVEPRIEATEAMVCDEAPATELGLAWYPDPAPDA